MQQITTEQMVSMLDETKGATFVGVIAVTDPYNGKPLKKSRTTGLPNKFLCAEMPSGSALVKVQRGSAMFNCHYNKAVERRVEANINKARAAENLPPLEGDALAAAVDERFRKGDNWQQVVIRPDGTVTPFAEHKTTGERYLRTMFYKPVGEVVYVDVRDGQMYEKSEIADVLPTESENKNQGLPAEETVRYNVWKLLGIRGLRMAGQAFRVRPPLEREASEVFEALNARLADMDIPEPPANDGN